MSSSPPSRGSCSARGRSTPTWCVSRGQERGELRTDVDPRLAAWILYGALEEILTGWVFERLPAGDDDVEQAERAVVALLTDGLAVD